MSRKDWMSEKEACSYLNRCPNYFAARRLRCLSVPPATKRRNNISYITNNMSLWYKVTDVITWRNGLGKEEKTQLSETAASIYLGKSKAYLTYRRRSNLPVPLGIQIGNRYYYKIKDLDAWKSQ